MASAPVRFLARHTVLCLAVTVVIAAIAQIAFWCFVSRPIHRSDYTTELALTATAAGLAAAVLALVSAAEQARLAATPPVLRLSWRVEPDARRLMGGSAGAKLTLRLELINDGPGPTTVSTLTLRPRIVTIGETFTELRTPNEVGFSFNSIAVEERISGMWNLSWSKYSDDFLSLGSPVTEGVSIFTVAERDKIEFPPIEVRITDSVRAQPLFGGQSILRFVFNIHGDKRSYAMPMDVPLPARSLTTL